MWKEASKASMHSNFPFSAVLYLYCKSSITSPPGGGGAYLPQKHLTVGGGGGLIEMGTYLI